MNDIVHQLIGADFENITISSAEGTGKLQDEKAFVSQKFAITDSQIVKLELEVRKISVDKVLHIISEFEKTLNPCDVIIYVSDVTQIYLVKDGLKNGD